MGRLTDDLEALCRAEPSTPRSVVVTLSEASQELKAAELGIGKVEEIPGLPGILKGCLPGEKILELIQREEIEEICLDIEVDIHTV